MFNEMVCAGTNDQQWYRVVPESFDVQKSWMQCVSVSGHIRDQCAAVRDEHSAAPKVPGSGRHGRRSNCMRNRRTLRRGTQSSLRR